MSKLVAHNAGTMSRTAAADAVGVRAGLLLDIPQIVTERLVMRAGRMDDIAPFTGFLASERSHFVGGPEVEAGVALRAFGHLVGLWVLRGYSMFTLTERATGRAVGMAGAWYPLPWPEPEFGWSLWHADVEGKGYVTEAMRAIMPWAWDRIGIDTAISVVDQDNIASRRVAEALGAVIDEAATDEANREGSHFFDAEAEPVLVYRHRRAA